jgi:superoxide dismutase
LEYQNERNRYVEEILKIINFSYANKLFANWHT